MIFYKKWIAKGSFVWAKQPKIMAELSELIDSEENSPGSNSSWVTSIWSTFSISSSVSITSWLF